MSENVDTICVQGGYQPGNGESRTPPIIQATTFKYQSSEQMSRLFDLSESGYFYTRLQNPTNDTVAAKICELEGGAAAMLTSSGQAANFFALFNICNNGDHIVASSAIYGARTAPKRILRPRSSRIPRPCSASPSPIQRLSCSTSRSSRTRRIAMACR